MLRTNSKLVKERVQQHIINRLSEDETEVLKEQLQNVVVEFKSWYTLYEQKRTPNYQNAFGEFMMGLPSCLSVEYSYYNMRNSIKEWTEQTEEQADKYADDKVSQTYLYLIYREFCSMCDKNDLVLF